MKNEILNYETLLKVTKSMSMSRDPEKVVQMFWQNRDMRDRIVKLYKNYPEILKKQAKNFDSLRDSEKNDILKGAIYLPHNFRTDSWPIAFYNRIFKEIFGNKGVSKLKIIILVTSCLTFLLLFRISTFHSFLFKTVKSQTEIADSIATD